MVDKPAQPNQSLQCGIECLLELASTSEPVGSREMARRLDQEHTRVNRLLGTLAHLGLAERTPDRKYAPGPGVHMLAALSLRGSKLLKCALPHIRDLMERTGERIALGVLWRDHVCYLYHGGPDEPLEAAIAQENLFPAEQSSIGLVLLAARADGRNRLGKIRRDGFALSPTRSLAVPVGDPPIAGLAVSGRVQANQVQYLVKELRDTAHRISVGAALRRLSPVGAALRRPPDRAR
jgi:DNA-binding IclR family transcriptional regulator